MDHYYGDTRDKCIWNVELTGVAFFEVVIKILGVLPLKYCANSSIASSWATSSSSSTKVSSCSLVLSIVFGTFCFKRV
jgi:hypothetical protein